MAERFLAAGQSVEEVAVVLKALADPNRLRIFDLLMQGDSCNCEVVRREVVRREVGPVGTRGA